MTRKSEAALAWITRVNSSRGIEYLTQWNDAWQAFSLIGGHVEDGETFQQCCIREIEEELECSPDEIVVDDVPICTLRFRERSKAAGAETDYEWQIFMARITEDRLGRLPATCGWLDAQQARRKVTIDGQAIADQVWRVVSAVEELADSVATVPVTDAQTSRRDYSGKVTWMADARRDLTEELCKRLGEELLAAFSSGPGRGTAIAAGVDPAAVQIVVKQRFKGFSDEPLKKIILAVEVQSSDGAHSGVVKIGDSSEVGGDYTGWQSCAETRGVTSRMFIAPVRRDVGNGRIAIIYPDVYQYYFDNGRDDEPKELESIVEQSILRNSPTFTSVERVLTQVFTEAYRCFYRHAQEDATFQTVLTGVSRSLRIGDADPVFDRWQQPEYLKLRRGAAWLTGVNRMPDSLARPEYIDPVDYLQWVLVGVQASACSDPSDSLVETRPEPGGEQQPKGCTPAEDSNPRLAPCVSQGWKQRIPSTLIGPAHGDLHGRNIIVGVVRGEAEWPAVFDFDNMRPTNVVAMDFAKLELELKCRLLPQLLESPASCEELRRLLKLSNLPPMPSSITLSAEDVRVQQRAERMRIMFAIEQLLNAWSISISSRGMAIRPDVKFEPAVPPETALGRALRIIFRIRREAAMALGYERQGRENRWRDEYNFALAVYGVTTAKWHSASDHLAWCLLSAGVAAANLSQLPWPVDPLVNPVEACDSVERVSRLVEIDQNTMGLESGPTLKNAAINPDFSNISTYLQLLPWAHTCWKSDKAAEPIPMLRAAIEHFPYAVALRQQLALLLVESSDTLDDESARVEIEELFSLACVFRDHEILSRFGRIYKDKGDRLLADSISHPEFVASKTSAYQHYLAAFQYYDTAFQITGHYYPGINAATLALLVGDHGKKESLADRVLTICAQQPLNHSDRTWIYATQGEASLLLNHTKAARNFYQSAFESIPREETGTIDSMYKQLRRLQWALGTNVVGPVSEVLSEAREQRGELTN